jgi:uncharacterized protein (DUF952 family)
MQSIYHLVPRPQWENAPASDYAPASLAVEGFIHCSHAGQVAAAANRFYAAHDDMLVLAIDPARLTSPLREEPASSGEMFPHVYGPINRAAVIAVRPLTRGADGRWQFSA